MLGIISLGSGSSGNSSVIYSERTSILVDAGLSAMQLKKRITLSGLNPNELNAVLITHEHTDHTNVWKCYQKLFLYLFTVIR